jgi:hypothetical protein
MVPVFSAYGVLLKPPRGDGPVLLIPAFRAAVGIFTAHVWTNSTILPRSFGLWMDVHT